MGLTSDAWPVCGFDRARVIAQRFLVFRVVVDLLIYRTVQRSLRTRYPQMYTRTCLLCFNCTVIQATIAPHFRHFEDPEAGDKGCSRRVNVDTRSHHVDQERFQIQHHNRRSLCPLFNSWPTPPGLLTHGALVTHVRRILATVLPRVEAPPVSTVTSSAWLRHGEFIIRSNCWVVTFKKK